MAVTSRPKPTDHHHLPLSNKWKPKEELSPERTKVWSEPNQKRKSQRKVPVVYYLSREGHLEQPHFMEVPLSSPEGLYLRDVISRLNSLRGKGMASMYSWSSKRSYKHGFVWQDLSENDFIYPCHGLEYVLKGSELVEGSPKSLEGIHRSGEEESKELDSPVMIPRRNQSWSAVDLHQYKVYKSEATGEFAGKAADAATQTDDKSRGRRRRSIPEEEIEEEDEEKIELNREEISPPPSSSSSETLETRGNINAPRGGNESAERDHTANMQHRMKASTILMQLISCGSFSVKECGSGRHRGLPVISEYGGASKELRVRDDNSTIFGGVEDKEYFSGSLIEVRKKDFGGLKRSASYNADRSLKMDLKDKEIVGVRARCMPRRPKNIPAKKEPSSNTPDIGSSDSTLHGSKRFDEKALKSNKDTVVP